jgi:ribonuclease HII
MTPRREPIPLPAAPDFTFESTFWQQGCPHVAGVDEAGRGALAGPVAAAAVIFPPDSALESLLLGVRDSKVMTPAQRERWAARLPTQALACGVGMASAEEIDRLGILPATRLAMRRALETLKLAPQRLLIDYLPLPEIPLPQTSLVKGDARCLSIAAASILAKTARDALLRQMEALYPGYGFAAHKGYGSAAHLAALARLGASPIHRRTFKPVAALSLDAK